MYVLTLLKLDPTRDLFRVACTVSFDFTLPDLHAIGMS
jgi:hypothetical protein